MLSTGAHDILKVFLEASAAKGEWVAALQSFNSVSSTEKTPCHTLLLCEAFANGNRWEKALSICQESLNTFAVPKKYAAKGYLCAFESYVKNRLPPPSRTESSSALPSTLSLSREANADNERIPFKKQELHWEARVAIQMATIGWKFALHCDSEQETVLCASSILRCCEEHIVPHLSPGHSFSESCEAWKIKLRELKKSCILSDVSQSSAFSSLCSTPSSLSPSAVVEDSFSSEASSSLYSSVATTPPFETSVARVPFRTSIAPQESLVAQEGKELQKSLFRILYHKNIRNTWKSALQVFFQMRKPGIPDFQALLECLGREGRVVEVENVVLELYQFRKDAQNGVTREMLESRWLSVRLSRRLLQRIVECATRLHSVKLCTLILSDRLLSSHLTPSSTVVLLSFLSRKPPSTVQQELPVVREWWEREVRQWNGDKESSSRGSCGKEDKGDEEQGHKKGYSLCTHLKVSSLVAKCMIRGSSSSGTNAMWLEALQCFQHSEKSNPDLALLFKLRLLREANEWKTAMALFIRRLEVPSTPTRYAEQDTLLRDCSSIFIRDNPSKWIPNESLTLIQNKIERRGLL